MSEGPPSPKRLRLDMDDLGKLNKEELVDKLREMDEYVSYLQGKQRGSVDKDDGDDKEDDKSKHTGQDSSRRENTLVLRLTNKEQELQDCMNQIAEMKASQTQNSAQLRSLLLDPAVNLVFQRMAKEMDDCKEKLKQTQNELGAWKFTADSQMGKRLMAKCRMLLQENEELGKMISSGRTSKLEAEIAVQKTLVTEMKTNQDEMNEFVSELEEDMEGMQSMIYVLQQQLKETKENLAALEAENTHLRTSTPDPKQEAASTNSAVNTGGACNCTEEGSAAGTSVVGEGCEGTKGGGEVAKARTTGTTDSSLPSQTPPVKVETTLQVKRTSGGQSDDVDGGHHHQPNGKESDVEKDTHDCSLAATESSDLRTDQTCEQAQSVPPSAKPLVENSLANIPMKIERDVNWTDVRTVTSDASKPVRNGELTVSEGDCRVKPE